MAPLETEKQETETDFTRLKKLFEEARDTTQSARDEAMIDLDYFHGKQWTGAEIAELKRRRQPVITYNLVKNKISSICGIEENSKTDPKAIPRTPNDENAATVATDVLRYVTERARFPQNRIKIFKDTLTCGIGGAIVEVEESQGRPEIQIRRIRFENVVYDPYSRESDFSDARYLGIAKWMDEADALRIYGEEAQEVITNTIDGTTLSVGSSTYEDRPQNTWSDRKRRRCLIVELYHNEKDGWHRSVFTGAGLISSNVSEYQDAEGRPSCPILLTSCYVNRENERYGLVRDMRSAQDEINHRRSKLLHLINTRQTFRKEGAIASRDPQNLRRELNRPDGDVVIAKNAVWGQDVGIIDTITQFQGQAELLAEAKSFLDQIGPNNALAGVKTESQSGRAILAQQQAGLSALATIFADHNDWVLRVFRQIWACARQFWTAPMYIRVTNDMESVKFIYVNEFVVDPMTGIPETRNRIAEMGVDLEVERVPHMANLQQEQFESIGKILQFPAFQTTEIFAEYIKNSSLRDKKTLIEAVLKPPPQEVVEMQQRGAEAEIAEKEASTKDKEAAALLKTAQAQKLIAEANLMNLQSSLGGPPQGAPLPQEPMPQEGMMPPEAQPQFEQMQPPQPMEPPIPEPPQLYGEAVPLNQPIEQQPLAPPQSGVF